MRADVEYLASDQLEGRGVGTKGLDLAAEYLAEAFQSAGLKTELAAGSPFQSFALTTGAKLAEPNELVLKGPDGQVISLELGADFTPLSFGEGGVVEGPLVFAGYGITAEEEEYDDYQGLDVKDKVVLVLRREPQQDNPHSNFDGTRTSRYAALRAKASMAYQHGAKAVLFVTDRHSLRADRPVRKQEVDKALEQLAADAEKYRSVDAGDSAALQEAGKRLDEAVARLADARQKLDHDPDPLLDFGYGGDGVTSRLCLAHVTGQVADAVLTASLGKDVAAFEAEIDADGQPHSVALESWRAEGRFSIRREQSEVKNVIAVLEGEGPYADETIVVGAHYDHLGHGGIGSLAPGSTEIHNGADDNASGTAGVVELARRLAERKQPLARRVVFIAFTAEEIGLLGSEHYVNNPLVPLEKTIAMVNFDMIGRLTDNKLTAFGTGTATGFDAMLDTLAAKHGFELNKNADGFGPSDQSSFYAQEVPVLHFFSGNHEDYHRPSDDVDKINVEGMRRIVDLTEEVILELAGTEARPEYVAIARRERPGGGGDRPYFGSIPSFGGQEEGYTLQGVSKDGPAAKAGLKGGDVIVRLGDKRIGNLEDFDLALRAHKAGETVEVVAKRDGEEMKFMVVLDPPR